MKIIKVKNYEEMSKKGFELIKKVIQSKDKPVLSLNTGGTPKGLYKNFVESVNNGLDVSKTAFLSLDEYIGPKEAKYTVRNYMNKRFFELIQQTPEDVFLINGDTNNVDQEIKRYTEILEQYPRDIQLLGIGTNGHLGANEPGTSFDSTIFLANHTEATIQSTMKEYNITREEAPKQMITLGFKEILEARQILLLASGKHKAQAVKDTLEGPITEGCPASVLRKFSNVTVIIDEEAASLLNNE